MAWRAQCRRLLHVLYWSPSVVYVTTQLYNPLYITGRSMQPALNPDSSPWRDLGLFNCISGMIDKKIYRKGDIVAVRSPENPNHKLVKRIVAMEGEVVHTLPPYPDPVVKIPQGHVWVQGDEPFFSDDSNLFGPIPMALIESKLIWILWPPSRFGPSPKGISSPQNEDAYRHAIATFEKDRTRTVRVTYDGISKY